jgi:hypothetical protein
MNLGPGQVGMTEVSHSVSHLLKADTLVISTLDCDNFFSRFMPLY